MDAFNSLIDKLQGWGDSIILMLPNFIVAILFFLVIVFISNKLKKYITKLIAKAVHNKAITNLLATLVTLSIIIVGFFIALSIMNLNKAVTSMLAGAGVVGLAIGLAFQDSIANVISGIVISARKQVKIGNLIETNGYIGTVRKVTLRSLHLKSFTGEHLIVPNKIVTENVIKNYSLDHERRVDLSCGVSYSDDLKKVEKIAVAAIENNIDFDKNRPVEFFFTEFGDSSINFTIRFWLVGPMQAKYLEKKHKAIMAIKEAFDSESISIPFPMRTLEFSLDKKEITSTFEKVVSISKNNKSKLPKTVEQ